MPKMTRTQLMHLDDEGRSDIVNTDLPNDGFVAEDPPVWLLRYPGFSRITTDRSLSVDQRTVHNPQCKERRFIDNTVPNCRSRAKQ